MKLLSCSNCGVVINQDMYTLNDEDFYEDDDFSIKSENASWTGSEFVATIKCPVCEYQIETDKILR